MALVRRISLLGLLLALAPISVAQATTSLLRVRLASPERDIPRIEALGLDVTHERGLRFADVLVEGPRDRARLVDAGYRWRIRVADLAAANARARRTDRAYARQAGRSSLPSGRTSYRRYDDYLRELDALVKERPGLVRAVTLPRRSVEGRPIVGVELSEAVSRSDDGKPVYVVIGGHHAREWPSSEVSMELATDLVRSFGRDARVTALLRRERVVIIPVVNPDGFIVSRENQTSRSYAGASSQGSNRRKNCASTRAGEDGRPCTERSGVDLNRNYGAYWGGNGASTDPNSDTYRGPAPWSEPESDAVHRFSQRLQITNLQAIHSFAALVLRPPGFRALGLAPDERRLKELGDAIGRAAGYVSEYAYELYEVTGAAEDWNYVAQGTFGYNIELGGSGGFQGPYENNVVNQYLGAPFSPAAGKGVREGLLLAGEQAADPRDHAIIAGKAPPGRILRVRKDFKTTTSPVCPVETGGDALTGQLPPALGGGPAASPCPQDLAPRLIDDFLETTTVVPQTGRFAWHVNPSTRPFVAKAGRTEAWRLTCESAAGVVLETQRLVVGRGQTATFADLRCGGAAGVSGLPASPEAAVSRTPLSSGTGPKPTSSAPPRGARLFISRLRGTSAERLAQGGRLSVGLRVKRATLKSLRVVVRDFDRQVVAQGRLARLGPEKRGVAVVRMPRSGLPRGVYKVEAQGVARTGAILTDSFALRIR